MDTPIQVATCYVRGNTELKEALGIPEADEIELHPLGQGEHNANFWFSHPVTRSKLVLRINYVSQLGLKDQIGYEYHALMTLLPSGRVPRPLFLDGSCTRIGHGVLVMEFCEGRHLDYQDQAALEEAARILADIHSVRVGESCRLQRPADPLRQQYEECERLFETYRHSPFEEARVTRVVESLFGGALPFLSAPMGDGDRSHVINTEAVSAHFLIPEGGGAGRMVDWEKPLIGEVAQDIAYFLSPTTTIWDTEFMFDAGQRDRFVRSYWRAVDGRFPEGRFERRFKAYGMTNCLRGITWSCAAWVEYHDPDRPLKNAKTFKKLETYLSDWFLDRVKRDYFTEVPLI